MARLSVEEQPDVAAHVLKRVILFFELQDQNIQLQTPRDTSSS
jgi:hypothetical protein